jgi:hypothetical protein
MLYMLNFKIGDEVKIVRDANRFWVLVRGINGNRVTGEVKNHLIESSIRFGEIITFLSSGIVDVSASEIMTLQ